METDWSVEDGPILNLVGENVALGPLRRELIPVYERWINDLEVTRTIGRSMLPVTREAEESWYQGASRGDYEIGFTIYERATLRPIGNTGLIQLDQQHGTAEFGILIGEKACWGRGYGTETTRLMLDFAFNVLNLHNVLLRVMAHNERGLRAYRRAGFREIGRRRESVRQGGRTYDMVYMDCLASQFESPLLGRMLR